MIAISVYRPIPIYIINFFLNFFPTTLKIVQIRWLITLQIIIGKGR